MQVVPDTVESKNPNWVLTQQMWIRYEGCLDTQFSLRRGRASGSFFIPLHGSLRLALLSGFYGELS